jgi:hypothetical protein
MKYHVMIETSGTMVFEIDSSLIDLTGMTSFNEWARVNAEEIHKYYNPIEDRISHQTIKMKPSCSKKEAFKILLTELCLEDGVHTLNIEHRTDLLKMLKPEE